MQLPQTHTGQRGFITEDGNCTETVVGHTFERITFASKKALVTAVVNAIAHQWRNLHTAHASINPLNRKTAKRNISKYEE